MSAHAPGIRTRDWSSPLACSVDRADCSSLLLHLAGKVFLLDARDVLARHDDESEVAVGQLHLDGGGIDAEGCCCLGSLFGGGLAVLVGVC